MMRPASKLDENGDMDTATSDLSIGDVVRLYHKELDTHLSCAPGDMYVRCALLI